MTNPFMDALNAQAEGEERGLAAIDAVLNGKSSLSPFGDFDDDEREPDVPEVDEDGNLTEKGMSYLRDDDEEPPAQFQVPKPAPPGRVSDGPPPLVPPVIPEPVADEVEPEPDYSPTSEDIFNEGVSGYEPSHEVDDEDDEDYSRSPSILDKIKDTLIGPGSWLSAHPGAKKPIAIGAVAAVIAIGVGMCSSGSPVSEPANPSVPQVQDTPAPPVEEEVEVGPIIPKLVNASCPPGGTNASNAFSSKEQQAWICPRALGIDGVVYNIVFDGLVKVQSIYIVPGWNYKEANGRNHWYEHRLVSQVVIRIGGKTLPPQDIAPSPSGTTITFEGSGIAAGNMSITILQTVNPVEAAAEGVPGEDTVSSPTSTLDDDEVNATFAVGQIVINGTPA